MLRERYNLVPPTLETDARIEGQRVTLDRWQALVLRLDEDPLYGQRWQMQPLASHVLAAPVQHDYTAKPGSDPASTGVPGQAVFRFRGIAPGTQTVVLEFKRPDEPATRTIRFDVDVR